MGKFYGTIGYATTQETVPGKWRQVVIEKKYAGEFIDLSRIWTDGQKINDDVNISAQIKIIADPFFRDHMHEIKYVKLNGIAWEVNTIRPSYPSYTLMLGGVYNGEVA